MQEKVFQSPIKGCALESRLESKDKSSHVWGSQDLSNSDDGPKRNSENRYVSNIRCAQEVSQQNGMCQFNSKANDSQYDF